MGREAADERVNRQQQLAAALAAAEEAKNHILDALGARDASEREASLEAAVAALDQATAGDEEKTHALTPAFIREGRHAIRGALAGTLGHIELLLSGAIEEREQMLDALEEAAESASVADNFIQEFFDIVSALVGEPSVPARPVHVPTLVHEIVDYADAHAQKHRVRVETEFSADARRVRIDADGFQQILEDLLDHAIHVAPPDSVVEVKIDNPDKASLRIELTHPGTCPMTESRHFEPFVSTRADAPRNLAAVQHLATMRAGSAGVELTPNGERLWVQLPQWQEIAKQEETGEKSGGVRVLVVEDDAAARAEIVQILRSAGFDAKDVANVDEAIQAVNNESFDAVTLDLLLGRRYSTKVLAAIRTGRNKDAAVLVLSATRPGNVTFPYPVQGHLQKPITKRTLLRAMRWSGHPPPDPGPVLVVRREPPDATFLAEAKSRGLILIHVHDLAQALQRLETNDPVVVVVDPVMGVGAKFRDSLQGVPLIFWGDDGVERPEAAGTFKEDTDAATLFDAVEQLISQQDAWGEEAWNQ